MRGIQFTIRTARTGRGIIPAHAGNTDLPHVAGRLQQDHPRACGEYLSKSTERSCRLGSSPRMRGILNKELGILEVTEIIPAHAGNTPCHRSSLQPAQDHPRACGEYGMYCAENILVPGSSPRMRGIPADNALQCPQVGIIPAHAGNTGKRNGYFYGSEDHPRACGEYVYQSLADCSYTGSSPRMRGIRGLWQKYDRLVGIIPAHAGNTSRNTR